MIDKESIDPNRFYRVKLKRAVKVGETWLRPCDREVRLSGRKAIAHYDDLAAIELLS